MRITVVDGQVTTAEFDSLAAGAEARGADRFTEIVRLSAPEQVASGALPQAPTDRSAPFLRTEWTGRVRRVSMGT